jgi:hypothetical protein
VNIVRMSRKDRPHVEKLVLNAIQDTEKPYTVLCVLCRKFLTLCKYDMGLSDRAHLTFGEVLLYRYTSGS